MRAIYTMLDINFRRVLVVPTFLHFAFYHDDQVTFFSGSSVISNFRPPPPLPLLLFSSSFIWLPHIPSLLLFVSVAWKRHFHILLESVLNPRPNSSEWCIKFNSRSIENIFRSSKNPRKRLCYGWIGTYIRLSAFQLDRDRRHTHTHQTKPIESF